MVTANVCACYKTAGLVPGIVSGNYLTGSIYHAAVIGCWVTVSIVSFAASIVHGTASIVYFTASIVYAAAFCHYGSVTVYSFAVFVLPAFVIVHYLPSSGHYGNVTVYSFAAFCLNGIVIVSSFTALIYFAAARVDYLIVTGYSGDVIVLYNNVIWAERQGGIGVLGYWVFVGDGMAGGDLIIC